MQDLIKKGKRVFTVGVAVTTIAWSIGMAALLPLGAQATTIASGDLIKASQPALYYYGANLKRYVFPNEKTYKTWYANFSGVKTISDAELAAIQIGGNATYKPGVKMVKITTDPKVYAVAAGGTLRWVQSEAIAVALYGSAWNTMIEDVPDAFFTNYTIGADVTSSADFSPTVVQTAATSINADKGLTSVAGGLAVALASDNPSAASIPRGAENVNFTKLTLTATGGTASITGLKVTRAGLSIDADVASIKLFVDGVQKGTSQSMNAAHQAVFSLSSSPITVSAGSPVTLIIAANIAAAATVGDLVVLSIAAATDITTTSAVSGTFPLNSSAMQLLNVAIGAATITPGPLNATDAGFIDPTAVGYRFTQINIAAAGEPLQVNWITVIKNGTAANTDVKDIALVNDTSGQTLGTVAGLDGTGRATFSNLNITIAKGGSVNLSIKASMAGGSGRTIGFDVHDGTNYAMSIIGMDRGFGVPINGAVTPGFCLAGRADYTCPRQTANQGYMTVSKSSSTPATGNIAQGGIGVPMAAFDFIVAGEAVNVTSTQVNVNTAPGAGTGIPSDFTNITLYNGATILAGPYDATSVVVGGNQTLTMLDSYTLPIGTNIVWVKANVATGTLAGEAVVFSLPAISIVAKGADSGKATMTTSGGIILPPGAAPVAGNNQTIKAAVLAIITAATPVASNLVVNAQDQVFANIDLNASAGGEDVRVSSITITDTTVGAVYTGIINLELWGDPDNTDAITENVRLQTSNSTATDANTVTFSFQTPIVVSKAAASRLTLKADVVSALGVSHTIKVNAVADVVASGRTTGNTLAAGQKSVSGVGQTQAILANGFLTIQPAADLPAAAQLVSASTGNSVMKYKLSAIAEPIDVTILPIVVDIGVQPGTIGNVAKVYLYADGAMIGSTSGYSVNPANGLTNVTLDSNTLVVPKDGYKTLEIKVDIAAKDQIDPDLGNNDTVTVGTADTLGHTTGTQVDEFYFGIGAGVGGTHALWGEAAGASYYLVTATGQASGVIVNPLTINSNGNAGTGVVAGSKPFTIHKGILTVTLNATSPSGTQTAGVGKDVLKLNLTATGDDITVKDIYYAKGGTATIANGGKGAGVNDAKWISDDNNTTYYLWAGATDWLQTGRKWAGGAAGTPLVVSAGTPKVIKLNGDTTGSATTLTNQFSVTPGGGLVSGIVWADSSIATGAGPITVDLTTTKSLPVNGGGLVY